jgi:hypothetical protein
VPARAPFDYAVLRVVPRVEREEFVNVGVVLFAPTLGFLGCEIALDPVRLGGLAPGLSPAALAELEAHLAAWRSVCAGDGAAGPIARMPVSERFHWLVAPRSTMLQTSAVHGGLTDDPAATLRRLFATLVDREEAVR